MINLLTTGLSNDNTNIEHISNERESHSTEYLQLSFCENKDIRKSYPQRNNRTKLNYRDLERGMYEEIRQSIWALGGPTLLDKNNSNGKRSTIQYDDDDDPEIIDLSVDEDEKSNNDINQTLDRLWCICNQPWDQSRHMLRCESCTNWYHGDCLGYTKEQAREFDKNGDQLTCPSCRGISYSIKSARSADESTLIKRKHSDGMSRIDNHSIRDNGFLSKSISYDESTKRSKTSSNSLLTKTQIHCIVHGCTNYVKSGWIYCSSACIRRHINDTLQSIQRSKGVNNEDIPTRNDILLYENKSKKFLEKNLVPKIEHLCTWINQHPSYEIIKPSFPQSSGIARSSSSVGNTTKSKVSSDLNKKKQTSTITSNDNTADIRSKVPTALYDKITIRLEKTGEKHFLKDDIRVLVKRIEEEMFRVYGKVDNSYKNKFRSLLANIINPNNNFFYKQILSKELTAKQIVAMKAEDMLPPEEKEKRKDQFEKEVQMIINAEQQTAEEMARHTRMKITRQGFVDNDTLLPMVKAKEQSLVDKANEKLTTNNVISDVSKSIISIGVEKSSEAVKEIFPSISLEVPPSISLTKKMDTTKPPKLSSPLPIPEQSTATFLSVDPDNDYIEPESPTGIDALIYDDDDDNDDDNSNHINTSSRSSTIPSPMDNTEYTLPYQQIIRDDYNPSKIQNETTSIHQSTTILPSPNQWRGIIHPSDIKIPCQSVHIYGESDYLIGHIPEQLIILGRLRLGDLWDYIRDSITVRDVLILTLNSSSKTPTENEIFFQYIDSIQSSGRAAVISKCANSSLIRDMYILAADTKDCPSSVLSSLFLPITFESKQLFLVIIGTGKRTTKLSHRSNENQSVKNFIYEPIPLQDSAVIRDPRLLRNKDPRLNGTKKTVTPPPASVQHSNENLLKESSSTPTTTVIAGDNLIEENMDVDDDQDDKHKKQIPTSSTSNFSSELNDVDDRFLAQDMTQSTTTIEETDHRKQRRKSRFSDLLPTETFFKEQKKSSPKSTDNNVNSTESLISSTTIKPIRFSFSKDSFRRQKMSISSTTMNQALTINSIRSTAMLNLFMQQQKTKNRFSSNTNEWKSNYMTHYHDFDQPEE